MGKIRKKWVVNLHSNASIISNSTNSNGSPSFIFEADFVWPDNSGALIFANSFYSVEKKGHSKEIVKIISGGSWVDVSLLNQEEQQSSQEKTEKENLNKKIIQELKSGYKYSNLDDFAKRLGRKRKSVEWALSQLVKDKKINITKIVDPSVQKRLDDYLPDIIKKHDNPTQETMIEMLKMKDLNDIDYVQLSIWLGKKNYKT